MEIEEYFLWEQKKKQKKPSKSLAITAKQNL